MLIVDAQKYVCPNCGGLVDYGSKFCPHCRYEFGEWENQNTNFQCEGDTVLNTSANAEIENEPKPKNNIIVIVAVVLAAIAGVVYWLTKDDTKQIVAEAIKTGNMAPVFELYRKTADEDKPQKAYKIADAAFEITLDEVNGNDNRAFLKTLYNAVNNDKNTNLNIEAGGRDEYMSPFVALVKYAYVQSELEDMKITTDNDIQNYLPAGVNIDAAKLDPHNIRSIYAWVEHPLDGGYVLYGTRTFFYETFPNYRNCLGLLYLPNGGDGSTLPGYAYNVDVLQFGTTTLTWQNGRMQDVPELLAVDGYFKDLLWKRNSLQDVYKPLDRVKKDLQTMHDNLQIIKKYYKTSTPNLNFDGLNFNSTEEEFYAKAPLSGQKGEGTIHVSNIFANGVVVDFMPYFNYQVQDSVTILDNYTGSLSNGIKIGNSLSEVTQKMKPYYQLSTNNNWVTYLMPNGQTYSFRFNNGYLEQINIREAPGWKN